MENTHIKNEEPTVTSNSETATVAASSGTDNNDTLTVTSSSPASSSASAFQPFQQLHEAVLAAVNSHSSTLPSGFLSAAVAAAAANSNVTIHPHPQQQQQSFDQQGLEQQTLDQHQPIVLREMDIAKKESVRASNRERKKKWRIHNEERSKYTLMLYTFYLSCRIDKDNDLRCRVNKRASKLYGVADSPAKQKWIQEEFEKRRQKRMDKERRKHIVNNVLSVPGSSTLNSSSTNAATTAATTSNSVLSDDSINNAANNDNNATNNNDNQISSYYTPLPQIDTATAAKLLDFPTDLQRQLLEQLNNSMMVSL
jgi:hypothetical protein